MSKIKLTVDGEERNILLFSIDYFHPDPNDRVWMSKDLLTMKKKSGQIEANYEQPYFLTLYDFDRNSPYAYRVSRTAFRRSFSYRYASHRQ
ncbi:MAG: hypothetical protein LBP85_06820 [Prevotellaceae bacterium]|jgi:hypothetical protein|nr:hypothetical protein [Prevotellaceae bacterium]